jgi:gluconokinase
MPSVPGLRSNYDKTGRLVYVGRMLDKIRLQAAGKLPADYHANLGIGFDARACAFLRVAYADLKARTLAGGTDEEILAWAFARGGARTDDECLWWNCFMMKRGWRDEATVPLQKRLKELGLEGKPVETFFDMNEYDEDRDPVGTQAWMK